MNPIKNNKPSDLSFWQNQLITFAWQTGILLLVAIIFSTLATAREFTDQANSDFDHLSTGFFLSPAHQDVECSDCHVRGVFKGTPTACDSCHTSSSVITALGKNAGHINSSGNCEECHGENGVNWAEINFKSHDAVIGDCSGCHNDRLALGKSKNHIPSSDKCEDCHLNTSTYKTGFFDHANTSSNCSLCHDGSQATGKTTNHINTTVVCESCHKSTDVWTPVNFVDHEHVLGTCFSCHNGDISIGKTIQHIPSNNICDECHNTTSFSGAIFDHSGTTSNCFSCHDDSHDGAPFYSGRHMDSSNTCESCHTAQPKDWYSISGVDHSDVLAGTCDACHKASKNIGPTKSTQHIPSNNECDDCHNTNNFPGALVDHSGISSNCFSCHDDNHDGAPFYSGRHMDSSNTCESCHTAQPKDWGIISGIDHNDVLAGTCFECHAGRNPYGTTKPNDHITSTNTCDNCHLNAGTTWSGAVDLENPPSGSTALQTTEVKPLTAKSISDAKNTVKLKTANQESNLAAKNLQSSGFVHPDDSANCINCHNGTVTDGKKINHFPTADSCNDCHQINNWSPVTRFDHDAALGSCAACHNNTLATGQSAHHINTLQICDDCHREDHWVPVIRVDHAATIGNCFSCHNRKAADGKPLNHISSDNNCDNCHITHIWSQVVMDHSNVTGSCSTCHNGRSAPAKPVNHIASNNTCNDCHRRRTWTPVYRVDHLAVVGSCSSCHTGRMAEGKPSNHPNTNNSCEECHRSDLWSLVTFNHDNVSGTCLSCHINDYKQRSHKKANAVYYTANELVDCAGSCHIYEDQTFSTIFIRRAGPDHRPARGAW
jgi:hypothetical protein